MNNYGLFGGMADFPNMLYAYVQEQANKHFARVNAEKAGITSREPYEERRERIRNAFIDNLGGIPELLDDPQPVWGELRERGQYSVQNVMFQAAPEVYVTATVWRPIGGEGPRPAVLFPCGHHARPREVEEYQSVCATFAVNGYVTLAFDPPAQGERTLFYNPTIGDTFIGNCVQEHDHAGLKCELVGQNIARYFIRDGIQAFNVLASLPEVDETRIAITGNSGGGTQSCYLMLAEERIAAAFPCTFITDREATVRHTMYHDAEQNVNYCIPNGVDYDDFFFVFAPKPAAVGAVSWDFFPIEGVRRAVARIKHYYSVFGAEEKTGLCEVETNHNYHPQLRRYAAEFFNRWLQPQASFKPLEGFEPEDPCAQHNTRTGQTADSIPGAKLVYEETLDAIPTARASRHVPTSQELAELLGVPRENCPLAHRILDTTREGDLTIEKLMVVTEPNIFMPILRLVPDNPASALVYCCDEGIESIGPVDEALLRKIACSGVAVYIIEPRGLGETKSRPICVWYTAEAFLSTHYRMLGSSGAALLAWDITRAFDYIHQREGDLGISVMADGRICWAALLAAGLAGPVERLCLRELRVSIEDYVTSRSAPVPQTYVIPGILKVADIPELVAAAGAGRVMVLSPRTANDELIGAPAWDVKYAEAWNALSAETRVIFDQERSDRIALTYEFLAR